MINPCAKIRAQVGRIMARATMNSRSFSVRKISPMVEGNRKPIIPTSMETDEWTRKSVSKRLRGVKYCDKSLVMFEKSLMIDVCIYWYGCMYICMFVDRIEFNSIEN
mmetsp:Transcript_4548/g.9937  ORF Transcript_4548/g.9937 Transcript_4548/m.9937 type:complete len:107 (+) Transcript_4548:675-995(+)